MQPAYQFTTVASRVTAEAMHQGRKPNVEWMEKAVRYYMLAQCTLEDVLRLIVSIAYCRCNCGWVRLGWPGYLLGQAASYWMLEGGRNVCEGASG